MSCREGSIGGPVFGGPVVEALMGMLIGVLNGVSIGNLQKSPRNPWTLPEKSHKFLWRIIYV